MMDDDEYSSEFCIEESKSLLKAVDDGNEAAIRCLLTKNVDINFSDGRRQTPLFLAVKNQNVPVIKLLLEKGCDVNTFTVDGDTPFIHSLHQYLHGNETITKLLLKSHPCEIKLFNALETVCQIADQSIDLIPLLINCGADILTEHENNKLQVVQHLLSRDNDQSLWKIIDSGLYIDAVTERGENIYHFFAKYLKDGGVDCSSLFLCNIHVDLQNNDNNSPLMIASFLHNKSFIQSCLEMPGRNVKLQNEKGHTALHLCIIGFSAIIKKLDTLKKKEYRNNLCDYNYYPNFKKCVDFLLKAGVNVNIRDKNGTTALMRAVMANDKIIVEKLLSFGADPFIVDNDGRYAIQYFNFEHCINCFDCFKLLYAHGGNRFLNMQHENGQTIIQNVLTLSFFFWNLDQTLLFIKFLIGRNLSLQNFTDTSWKEYVDVSDDKITLREIFYLSGAPSSEIMKELNFDMEERVMQSSNQVKPRQSFVIFCNSVNMRLEKLCRRVIRQTYGLNILSVAAQLDIPHISDFLLLQDCPDYGIPYSLDDDRLIQNNDGVVNYDLYDCDNDGLLYDIQYLNENSFYHFS